MDPLSIFSFVILIILSAFFSGTEIALMTTSKHAVQSLVREKKFGAKSLEKIKENTDKLLITILIGNNIVNVASSALATVVTVGIAQKTGLPEATGVLIATATVTLLLLLFGEITPKTICTRYNVQISLLIAPFYRILMIIFAPITFLMELFLKGMMALFGGNNFVKTISYQEVEAFIDMSHEEGEVEDDERRQMKNLLSLRDMSVESVMTPRVNVVFLSLNMTVDEACKIFLESPYSRMPVYKNSADDAEYIFRFREAFTLQSEGKGNQKLTDLELEKIMKVPLTQRLDGLFEKFQRSHRHFALIIDEYGGTAGIITMEDILEEVFGDIKDETDKEEIFVRKRSDGSIQAVGSVLMDDILEEYNLHCEDIDLPEEYRNETLSYVIMAEEEEFPQKGTQITFGEENEKKLLITVLEIEHNVIEKVECRIVEE